MSVGLILDPRLWLSDLEAQVEMSISQPEQLTSTHGINLTGVRAKRHYRQRPGECATLHPSVHRQDHCHQIRWTRHGESGGIPLICSRRGDAEAGIEMGGVLLSGDVLRGNKQQLPKFCYELRKT